MNPTVEFLWSRHQGLPASAADWAIQMLEGELESVALVRLTDRNLPCETQNRLLVEALHDVRRSELLDEHALRVAYESESIADYFAGRIDGWTLIQRGCGMYLDAPEDEPGRVFWIGLADDADEHGGQGIFLQYPFAGNDFNQVLHDAIRNSGRPLPDRGAHPMRNPDGSTKE